MEIIYKDTKYTEGMILKALDDIDNLKQLLSRQERELRNIRNQIFQFFNEKYETGNRELIFNPDDTNSLLENIGCPKLKSLFMVRANVDVIITGIEADNADAASDEVNHLLTVEWNNSSGSIDNYEIEIINIEQDI